LHHFHPAEMTAPLQGNQQSFDFVNLNMVAGQSGNVMCECVAPRLDAGLA